MSETAESVPNNRDRLYRLWVRGALAAGAILCVCMLAWQLNRITWPHPLEVREPAIILSTQQLLAGQNPYALDIQPAYVQNYGILFNLIAAPVAWMFGSGFPSHRAVAFVFLLTAVAVLCWALHHEQVPKALIWVAGMFLYARLANSLNALARPDSLGLSLYLATLVIPWRMRYSIKSLVIAAILGTLAFYTKPYFVLGIPMLALLVFLTHDKVKGVLFFIGAMTLLVATTPLVNRLLPCYFTNVFFMHAGSAGSDYRHLLYSSVVFLLDVPGLLFVIVGCAIVELWRRTRSSSPDGGLISWGLRTPLVNLPLTLPGVVLVTTLVIWVVKLGKHPGNWDLYQLHLFLPFVVWSAIKWVERFRERSVLPIVLVVLNLLLLTSFMPQLASLKADNWIALEAEIDASEEVFGCSITSHFLAARNRPVYESGQSEYWAAGGSGNFTAIADAYVARGNAFIAEIEANFRSQAFDLLVLYGDKHPFADTALIRQYYVPVQELVLPVYAAETTVVLWRRRPPQP